VITELRPHQNGVLVRQDGLFRSSCGWGYEELEVDREPAVVGPSVWELLKRPLV
jgi:hypothetical protein